MIASAANPIYTVYLYTGNKKYDVTPVLVGLEMSESKKQMAQCATIRLMNVMMDGQWLSSKFNVRDRICIFANDGTKNAEVFRGFVWNRDYQSTLVDREMTLKCYDGLIYMQESEDFRFVEDKQTTEKIISTISYDWGMNMEYSYESIEHDQMALRGTLSDILISDILSLVKDRTGKDFVILSEKDTMKIKTVGQNSDVQKVEAGRNAISVVSKCTMDGMITKVAIFSKEGKDDRREVKDTKSENTARYGTLQKIILCSDNKTEDDAKTEASNILKNNSTPKWEYEVTAIDIPWVRKGDKIYVNAGDLAGKYLIVTDISRSIDSKSKTIVFDGIEA